MKKNASLKRKAELKKPEGSLFKKMWLYLGILIVSVWLAYSPVLNAPFVWDDLEMVVNNPLIRSTEHVTNIFNSGAFLESAESGKFYRPLQILSYTFDYAMGELNPTYFHVTSVVIHTVTVLVLFFLLAELGLSQALSFGVALVFAVHPLNTEAVTYVSGRGDVLLMMFCMMSFYAFIKGLKGHWGWFIGSALAWTLAIFSKENAIVLPLVMALYVVIFNREKPQKAGFLLVGLLGGMGAYILFRLKVMHLATQGTLSVIALAPLWQRILTIPHILLLYVKLLFIPFPLHMEYHFVDTSLASPYLWGGLLVGGALIAFFLTQIKPIQKTLFYLGWFFIGLGPVYQLLPLASTVREHWVYFSEIGFFVLLGLFIEKNWKCEFKYGFVAVVFVLMGLTVYRNLDWRSPFKLYSHDVQYEPLSFLLHNNLGYEYYMKGDMAMAKASFLESIQVAPGAGYGTAMNNYAVILENEGHVDQAIPYLIKSIDISQYQLAYANLGRIYIIQKHPDLAIPILKQGSQVYPSNADIHYFLGIAYAQLGQRQEAKAALTHLDALYPNYKNCRQILVQL